MLWNELGLHIHFTIYVSLKFHFLYKKSIEFHLATLLLSPVIDILTMATMACLWKAIQS